METHETRRVSWAGRSGGVATPGKKRGRSIMEFPRRSFVGAKAPFGSNRRAKTWARAVEARQNAADRGRLLRRRCFGEDGRDRRRCRKRCPVRRSRIPGEGYPEGARWAARLVSAPPSSNTHCRSCTCLLRHTTRANWLVELNRDSCPTHPIGGGARRPSRCRGYGSPPPLPAHGVRHLRKATLSRPTLPGTAP